MLGPLLFLLFVNHSRTHVISRYTFFANDLEIYSNIRYSKIVDISSDLFSCQRDINAIVHVASSWGLRLNAAICVLHGRSLLSKEKA